MDVNLSDVLGEVAAAFARYERALMQNDIAVLDELFWADPRTIRYGIGEVLHGIEEIRSYRRDRPTQGLARTLQQTVITTFGREFATASTLFTPEAGTGRLGRQQQSWVRFPAGWRIVAAHVSFLSSGSV